MVEEEATAAESPTPNGSSFVTSDDASAGAGEGAAVGASGCGGVAAGAGPGKA